LEAVDPTSVSWAGHVLDWPRPHVRSYGAALRPLPQSRKA